MSATLDVAAARAHFPALQQKQIYFDNAGGSQILKEVVDAISAYLLTTNVQLGATYPVSAQSTSLYTHGCAAVADYIRASSASTVVLGASTTQLFRNLSLSLWEHVTPGSEIIISLLDHEANIASWVQLAAWRGVSVVWWRGDGDASNPHLTAASLMPLLNERTRLVACTHTSNVLGSIHDVKALAEAVHGAPGGKALLCVDAVAYAPHRAVDVAAWGVDFYAFSWYKVYGPHVASLYASERAQGCMGSLGHYFKSTRSLEDKLGLAAASYELVASVPAVVRYLDELDWDEVARHEEKLQAILLEYLAARPDVFTVRGEPRADRTKRVPVISFTVKDRSSREVVEAIEKKSDFGCRWGAFYSNRLCKEVLGLDEVDGVVRASFCHYNTEQEVSEYVKVLDSVVFPS